MRTDVRIELTKQKSDESPLSEAEQFTPIANLRVNSRAISVRFKVLSIEKPRIVSSTHSQRRHLVTKAIVADETGRIDMILWNDDVEELRVHKTYSLKGGHVKVYEECMQLSRGRLGRLEKSPENLEDINQTLNMSRPFMGRRRRMKKRPRSRSGRTLGGVPGREKKGYCSSKGF
jgi:hypothetical protein